jgi:broad specificity phosphatase PhoE
MSSFGRTLSGRRRDVALSPEGLEQAEIVADLLGTEPLAAVYSSPRERAWYTAREIAEPHELKVEIADGSTNSISATGPGCSFARAGRRSRSGRVERASASVARPPGGESMAKRPRAPSRARGGAPSMPDQMIAAVSHCDIIRG